MDGRTVNKFAFSGVLLLLLLVLSLNSDGTNPGTSSPEVSGWMADGVIEGGEYAFNHSTEAMTVFLGVEGENLVVGLRAETPGWVAIGFGDGPGMKVTDIVIAYVLPNGTVEVGDFYSTGFSGPHEDDRLYGGSFDIREFGGSEVEGITTVEFSRSLKTADSYDFQFPENGSVRVIWAYGPVDDFLSMHSDAGAFEVKLGEIPEG